MSHAPDHPRTARSGASRGPTAVCLALICIFLCQLGACTGPLDPTADADFPTAPDAGSVDSGPHPAPDATAADTNAPPELGLDCGAENGESSEPGPTIRVATFNLQRLFDTDCDSGRCEPGQWEAVPSPADYRARIDGIAEATAAFEADILLFQEIEEKGVLEDLAAALEAEGRAYPVLAFGETGAAASVDVGILARGQLQGEPLRYRDSRRLRRPNGSPTAFSREFLGVRLRIDGQDVVAFNSHFKSKVNDDPGRRLAEAREARQILTEIADERPEALVVFGGDLNDIPGSAPMEELTENDAVRRAGANQPVDQTWSYCFREQILRIDHILWAPTCGGRYLPGTTKAWGKRICPARQQLAGSDHAAVTADFRLR